MIRITMQNGKTIDIELDHSAAPMYQLASRLSGSHRERKIEICKGETLWEYLEKAKKNEKKNI